MIHQITSQFDWVFKLPIESQCRFAVGISLTGFLFAALVRETCKHRGVRYGARAIGAASFFAVAAFANHVSIEYEKLNTELMVRKNQKASEIDASVLVTLVTPKGNRIEMGEDENGVRGIGGRVRNGDGCLRRVSGIYSNAGRQPTAGTMGRTGANVDCNDVSGIVAGMLKRAGWNGNDDGSQRRFQLSRDAEGENF